MSDSSPYRTIAVAITFSPRVEQVLAEAKRIRDLFEAELQLIYVGRENDEVRAKFRETLRRVQLPADSVIHYEEGDPAEGILRAIDRHDISLVVAGALEKELVLHPFLGNVARRLLRDARRSVILFTTPQREPKPLRNIVFITDHSAHSSRAFRQALRLFAREKPERLFVIRVSTTFAQARAAREGAEQTDEDTRLEQFVLAAGQTDVPIEVRCIRGNTGFVAADFVKSVQAELLIVPLEPAAQRGPLPSNLEWLTDIIPCNLWVIRGGRQQAAD